jgi:hypothetical protein
MLLTSLQTNVARPHLGRIELACHVGVADIQAHVLQVVRELAKDAVVLGFRKGKAPLKRVQAQYIKEVRVRALGRLVDSIQEAAGEQVGRKYRVLGTPKPEYDKDARLDELASFEVQLAYDIDPMSDDLLAPKGLVNMPDTGEPGAGPPGARDLGMGHPVGPSDPLGASSIPRPPGIPSGPKPPSIGKTGAPGSGKGS